MYLYHIKKCPLLFVSAKHTQKSLSTYLFPIFGEDASNPLTILFWSGVFSTQIIENNIENI